MNSRRMELNQGLWGLRDRTSDSSPQPIERTEITGKERQLSDGRSSMELNIHEAPKMTIG